MAGVLEGKVALVTGGAQGIGVAFARALAQAGAAVALADVADASAAAGEITAAGGTALSLHLDVREPQSVAAAMEQLQSAFGGLDILVNNAAIASALTARPFTEITEDEWDRVLSVNLRGGFSCMKAAAPMMRERGQGAIVNIASATALKGTAGYMHYVASKGGVIAMTRAAARELGPHGIRVNAIAPGLIMTDKLRDHASYRGDALEAAISTRALKREAVPEDVVGTLIYLVSPQSAFVTGQTIIVDGGFMMN